MSSRSFYQEWYAENIPESYDNNALWQRYVHGLRQLIASLDMPAPRGLEIGSGGGQLQDLVPDYIGVDLAASAGRFVSRPFSAASAAALPFADQSFDIVWSIWTLEHVIHPEQMLREMLRVTRPRGYIFLCAAWSVPDWTTRGYHRGAWRQLSLPYRILRLSIYPRKWMSWPAILAARVQQFLANDWHNLRYRFLVPNYAQNAEPDADACIQIDPASVVFWFRAHGATCESHPDWCDILTMGHAEPLIFRRI